MGPHRTSPGGNYRIDRRFPGVGRIALSSGTTSKKTLRKLDNMLTELFEDGYLDVLEAIQQRRLTLREVYQAKRAGRMSYVVSDLLLQKPLWEEVADWIPRSARAQASRDRYETSWKGLRKRAPLEDDARVRDLADLDWTELKRSWPNSGADWNRMRAAVSRFLTMLLEDKYHPFRREIMNKIPRARESKGRVPDLTPDVFWDLIAETPEHARPAFVTLAVTGMRIRSEYLELEDHHLRPHTRTVAVPGTKTEGSEDVIRVGEQAWAWIERAVPPPLQYRQLYRYFKRAAESIEKPDLTPHDLRHLHGMMLSAAGEPEARIQASLRHEDPSMTRRYTRQRDRGEAAETVDRVLFGEPEEPDRGEETA